MRDSERRLVQLETKAGMTGDGWDWRRPCHQIIVEEDQSEADAVRAYGIEKIGERDNIIFNHIVSPKFDAAGNMIPPPPVDIGLRQGRNWRDLCGL